MSSPLLKDVDTIAKLRQGGVILAKILDELETVAKPGNSTLNIDDLAAKLLLKHKLEPMTLGYNAPFASRPYPATTCVSINDVLVHGIPNENPSRIKDGDLVSIDLVIGYQGVVLDSARTVGVGNISPEAKELLKVTRAALSAGIKAAKPGNYIGDIGAAIARVVPKKFGIVEALCGHGVGYKIHEPPNVPNYATKKQGIKMKPGLVLAIEPMIIAGPKEVIFDQKDGYTVSTKSGDLGAHMEHTVLITKSGSEVLTKAN